MIDLSKHTNVSLEPVGVLDGFPIRPCMKSGFCCMTAPCGYGEWDPERKQCKFLGDENELGQRDCGRYEFIMDNVPPQIRDFSPAFGFGCCMAIGNLRRNAIIEKIKEINNEQR
jgi:hypothetical protein